MTASKPIHTIVLDAGPMLKNHPPISSLQAKAERLVTVPAVISEIRDAAARSRVETTWMPFLEIVSPNDQSIKIITNFATRTGDLAVLSKPDVEILALTYQLEEQRNGLSYIRTSPAQQLQKGERPERRRGDIHGSRSTADTAILSDPDAQRNFEEPDARKQDGGALKASEPSVAIDIDKLSETTNALQISDDAHKQQPEHVQAGEPSKVQDTQPESDDSDSESDGWITSSNIQRHQAKEHNTTVPVSAAKPIDVACITSDFAMQNVLLSMNLNLLNPSFERIRNIKTFILRCHACFEKTKDMKKQFCPRCGKPTLTRVSCSTNSKGEFKMHLKKNMQWNHRGDRYSIPKAVSGSANGKAGQRRGGGKGGWGQNLILAEDQKEFLRATGGSRRKKETDPMDEAYLPSILTGDRGRAGGRPKIGAGRNVNSKKR